MVLDFLRFSLIDASCKFRVKKSAVVPTAYVPLCPDRLQLPWISMIKLAPIEIGLKDLGVLNGY
jgi:hypothetical protein